MSTVMSIMCKCWDTVYCVCTDVVSLAMGVNQEFGTNDIKEWKRIEHIDQAIKHYHH